MVYEYLGILIYCMTFQQFSKSPSGRSLWPKTVHFWLGPFDRTKSRIWWCLAVTPSCNHCLLKWRQAKIWKLNFSRSIRQVQIFHSWSFTISFLSLTLTLWWSQTRHKIMFGVDFWSNCLKNVSKLHNRFNSDKMIN